MSNLWNWGKFRGNVGYENYSSLTSLGFNHSQLKRLINFQSSADALPEIIASYLDWNRYFTPEDILKIAIGSHKKGEQVLKTVLQDMQSLISMELNKEQIVRMASSKFYPKIRSFREHFTLLIQNKYTADEIIALQCDYLDGTKKIQTLHSNIALVNELSLSQKELLELTRVIDFDLIFKYIQKHKATLREHFREKVPNKLEYILNCYEKKSLLHPYHNLATTTATTATTATSATTNITNYYFFVNTTWPTDKLVTATTPTVYSNQQPNLLYREGYNHLKNRIQEQTPRIPSALQRVGTNSNFFLGKRKKSLGKSLTLKHYYQYLTKSSALHSQDQLICEEMDSQFKEILLARLGLTPLQFMETPLPTLQATWGRQLEEEVYCDLTEDKKLPPSKKHFISFSAS